MYTEVMATNQTTITPELEAQALSVVASLSQVPAGFVPATTVEVGQVVSCWGHNKQRVGVVTEVSKTRAKVLFTTPGAIKEAQDGYARSQAAPRDVESYIDAARRLATSNYLYYLGESRVETAKYGRFSYGANKGQPDTEHLLKHANQLCEVEDEGFEARLRRGAEASLADAEHRRTIPWEARVGYTHGWKKIADLHVQEVTA